MCRYLVRHRNINDRDETQIRPTAADVTAIYISCNEIDPSSARLLHTVVLNMGQFSNDVINFARVLVSRAAPAQVRNIPSHSAWPHTYHKTVNLPKLGGSVFGRQSFSI